MYTCLLYPLNYEEYQKSESETDKKLKEFSILNDAYEGEYPLLDEAYVVKLDVDYFEPDTAMNTEYFLVLIGDDRCDHEGICNVIYGWCEEYAQYRELMAKGVDALNKDENFQCYLLHNRFAFLAAADLGEEFQKILSGTPGNLGEVIKKVF